ncbi:hypothetical protein HK102_005722, partial [Quaeritorhiza haematococci]
MASCNPTPTTSGSTKRTFGTLTFTTLYLTGTCITRPSTNTLQQAKPPDKHNTFVDPTGSRTVPRVRLE